MRACPPGSGDPQNVPFTTTDYRSPPIPEFFASLATVAAVLLDFNQSHTFLLTGGDPTKR